MHVRKFPPKSAPPPSENFGLCLLILCELIHTEECVCDRGGGEIENCEIFFFTIHKFTKARFFLNKNLQLFKILKFNPGFPQFPLVHFYFQYIHPLSLCFTSVLSGVAFLYPSHNRLLLSGGKQLTRSSSSQADAGQPTKTGRGAFRARGQKEKRRGVEDKHFSFNPQELNVSSSPSMVIFPKSLSQTRNVGFYHFFAWFPSPRFLGCLNDCKSFNRPCSSFFVPDPGRGG